MFDFDIDKRIESFSKKKKKIEKAILNLIMYLRCCPFSAI